MFKLPVLPKIVMDILGHIPTIAFKTINLSELLSKSKTVLFNMREKQPRNEWLEPLKPFLPKEIKVVPELPHDQSLIPGEDVLRLYFSQLKSEGVTFLDLRAHRFARLGEQSLWHPSSMVYQFDSVFKATLIRLYKGFYYEDQDLFFRSLSDLGLTKNLKDEEVKTLVKLFHKNFGENFRAYPFNLQEFQDSFHKIFEFFLEYKVELTTDFLYLGVYITTLFMHLDQHKKTFNVEAIFIEIFPKEI